MAKPEWGLKRTCRDCGKRFYDFHRVPIVCPGCQAVFDPLAMLRPRRGRATAAAAPAPPGRWRRFPSKKSPGTGNDGEEAALVDVEDDDIDSDDDDGMIKGVSDLGGDDIPDVIADNDD